MMANQDTNALDVSGQYSKKKRRLSELIEPINLCTKLHEFFNCPFVPEVRRINKPVTAIGINEIHAGAVLDDCFKITITNQILGLSWVFRKTNRRGNSACESE